MKVLVAYECSGRVREAFRRRGHDAWSCDIQAADDGSPYHLQGDALQALDLGWDMLIAHPPCTYLSNVGARWLFKDGKLNEQRYALGLEGKAFFMALWQADIPRVVVENPIPSKIYELPAYSQIIQPYYFGDPWKKTTCLWLRGVEPLVPRNMVEPQSAFIYNKIYQSGGKQRQKNRSVTAQGIADAMAEQWG